MQNTNKKEYSMKKLLLFLAGISILSLAGCSNGNQSHGNEGMGDSLPADPPLGYVIELNLWEISHIRRQNS